MDNYIDMIMKHALVLWSWLGKWNVVKYLGWRWSRQTAMAEEYSSSLFLAYIKMWSQSIAEDNEVVPQVSKYHDINNEHWLYLLKFTDCIQVIFSFV